MCHILPGGICYIWFVANTPPQYRLAAFAATLVVLLGGGVAAGKLIEPLAPRTGAADVMTAHAMAIKVSGLAVADDNLRLPVAAPEFTRGRAQQLRFRIVDSRNRTVH